MEKNGLNEKAADGILFSYQGEINEYFTRNLLNELENLVQMQTGTARFRRNVFTVVNEALQNIEKYALVTPDPKLQPSIVIANSENGYIFTITNAITRASYQAFKQRLDFIKGASITELRNEYLRQLFDETAPDGNSAGLGLLSIAIRANKLLNYTFTEVDENKMSVSLVITTER